MSKLPDISQISYQALPVFRPFLESPHGAFRHRLRGAGGTPGGPHAAATRLVLQCLYGKHRALCGREYQKSIDQSAKRLITDKIYEMGVDKWFDIQSQRVVGRNGCASEIDFVGLATQPEKIRSFEGATIVWLEEAHLIPPRGCACELLMWRRSACGVIKSRHIDLIARGNAKRYCGVCGYCP